MGWMELLLFEAVCRHTRNEIMKKEGVSDDWRARALEVWDALRLRTYGYAKDYIVFWLPLRILFKKGAMIEAAETKKELDEIVKPSVPKGCYGKFEEGPYHVREEEMILWSRASLEAPLNEDGYKRYAWLFSQFFPKEAEEIFGRQ